MPGGPVATSLWFQKHWIIVRLQLEEALRRGIGGHRDPATPFSHAYPPCHHNCINPSSLAHAAPGARRVCVAVYTSLLMSGGTSFNTHAW
ncbi:hypothetical protein CgunFtcFv8_006578 [Champsocephalus gunnari]|uniref:Uncharacterized protein n=1 Tax=Champsocephalus gunnari TaxID=52237 RepID=A0AAN8BXJ5_CHAGU|nr:hypothetical protein CgunFtcFv8_006578 [Champsocephalus gunnari]